MDSVPKRPAVLKSAMRALAILSAMEPFAEGKQLASLSEGSGLDKATALRILRTLVAEGLLERDAVSGRYGSSPRSWTSLAPFLDLALSFVSSVQGVLDQLAESAHATSLVVLPGGGRRTSIAPMHSLPRRALYYDPAQAPQAMLLHSTASGKCYLAAQSQAQLATYLASGLESVNESTATSPSALRKELRQVRKQGYAVSRVDSVDDITGLAVPLHRPHGAVIGGVTLVFTRNDLACAEKMTCLPLLRNAARRISDLMGYDSWMGHVRISERATSVLPALWETPDPGFGEGPTPYVRTVARMVRLLAALLTRPEGMSLSELARTRKLDKTATWRLLHTLETEDLVWQDAPDRQYRVSPLFWIRRASLIRSASSLTEASKAALQDVADATAATTLLVLPDSEKRHAVTHQFALPHSPVCFRPEYDIPTPLHTSAAGKCYLAAQCRLTVENYIRKGLTPVTRHSIISRERLLRELEVVREKGYALNREETNEGVGALAVPVVDNAGDVVASIVVVPIIQVLTEANIERWLPVLQEAASRLSPLLGPGWQERLGDGAAAGQ